MKRFLTLMLLLASCAAPTPEPTLPEGAATTQFTVTRQSFVKGLIDFTYGRSRAPSILDASYDLSCLASGARARRNEASRILEQTFLRAPIDFGNPRERGWWRASASRAVHPAGCIVTGMRYETKTTDRAEVIMWVIENNVPLD